MNPVGAEKRIQEGDAALVTRAAGGDQTAFAALYDKHSGLLYGLACRMLGPSQDAEDAVQDAFMQAWNNAAKYDPAKGSARSWLALLCRSRCLDRIRRRGTRGRYEASAAAPEAAEDRALSAPEWERARLAAEVREAVAALPAEQRRAVEEAFFEGLSHSEVAQKTGEPLGTVKTRLRLAAKKLSEKLRPLWDE